MAARNRPPSITERRTRPQGSKADRRVDVANDQPDLAGLDSRAEDRRELLEVHGFDLLAQIEAMFRHAREFQREVQRLRGILGQGQTETPAMNPLAAVRPHVERMQQAYASFGETLEDAQRIVDSLKSGDASRSSRS